jgi:hypothetical protein
MNKIQLVIFKIQIFKMIHNLYKQNMMMYSDKLKLQKETQ